MRAGVTWDEISRSVGLSWSLSGLSSEVSGGCSCYPPDGSGASRFGAVSPGALSQNRLQTPFADGRGSTFQTKLLPPAGTCSLTPHPTCMCSIQTISPWGALSQYVHYQWTSRRQASPFENKKWSDGQHEAAFPLAYIFLINSILHLLNGTTKVSFVPPLLSTGGKRKRLTLEKLTYGEGALETWWCC